MIIELTKEIINVKHKFCLDVEKLGFNHFKEAKHGNLISGLLGGWISKKIEIYQEILIIDLFN